MRDFLGHYNETDLADPNRFLPKNLPDDAVMPAELPTHEATILDIRQRDDAYAVYWSQLGKQVCLMVRIF